MFDTKFLTRGSLTFSLFMLLCSYLVTVMGLVIPWSVTLLVVDAYSVFIKCLPHQRRIILIIILGDMVCVVCDHKLKGSRCCNNCSNDIEVLYRRFYLISH